jgi:two-component system OmpR family response regulator
MLPTSWLVIAKIKLPYAGRAAFNQSDKGKQMITAYNRAEVENRPSAAVRHILIVDSEPAAALVTQRGLQRWLGPDVDVAIVPAGVAWLRCLREPIDLVIIDPAPQDRAASALLKALREQCPKIALMVLTAYDTVGLRTQMRRLGVHQYLAKPATLDHLVQAVRVASGLESYNC